MGMGLLGALSGLGAAGQQVGNQLMQAALKEEDNKYLEERQMRIAEKMEQLKNLHEIDRENRQVARVDKQRGDIANLVNGIELPEGASEKDRALAVAAALQGKGLLAEGDHFYKRAKDIERSDYEKGRLESSDKRDSERFAIQNAREERLARAQEQAMQIQSAASQRAAESQRFEREDRKNKESAQGMLAGYKVSKERGLNDAAEVYLENALGLGIDPRMIDKNDPLSSQVSAAKAVLADFGATDEQKDAARQVLTLANSAFVEKRGGSARSDNGQKTPSAPKLFSGDRDEELAKRLKALAQQKK